VIEGRAVWHYADDDGVLAVARCRIHGRQLQLTQPVEQVAGRKPPCKRCTKILGR
jgi:hypothetical protein